MLLGRPQTMCVLLTDRVGMDRFVPTKYILLLFIVLSKKCVCNNNAFYWIFDPLLSFTSPLHSDPHRQSHLRFLAVAP